MVSIKEVAERAGVSSSTVSRLLSGKLSVKSETRARIMRAVEELDYKPSLMAKSLRSGESRLLGFIIPNIVRPFYPQVMKHLEDLAYQSGYNIILCDASESTEKESEFLQSLISLRVDGIVFLPSTEETKHIVPFVGKLPIVVINRKFDIGLPCVLQNDYEGGYQIGKHLCESGHRRIACVIDNRKRNYNIERYEGFCRAMRENGIADYEDYIVRGVRSPEEVPEKLLALLKRENRPTAVFGFDDTLAYGTYQAAHTLGLRIPEDLAVVGYDDLPFSQYMIPKLSSYSIPFKEINKMALNILLENIRERTSSGNTVVRVSGGLVIRASSAPAPEDG